MSDKDDLHKKTPEGAENAVGSANAAAADDALGLDLSADPEFLALAADFDAAIKQGKEPARAKEAALAAAAAPAASKAEETKRSADVDFVLIEPKRAEPEPETARKPGGEPAGAADSAGPAPDAEHEAEQEALPEEKKRRGFFGRGKDAAKPEKSLVPPKNSRLAAPPQANATFMSRFFDTLALGGILVLAAVFLAQVLPSLQSGRLLWFSDELRQADVLAGVFQGHWLQIHLNGQLYQEAPPLYFWFLAGLHYLLGLGGIKLGSDYAQLLYVGAAVSGFLFLLATYSLARSTARLDRRGALASGCVLLSVLFLVFFFHYSSLDLFFAAFIIFSHVFLFKALMRERAPLYMGLAFLCAAVALMSKGALGLALPVLSAVLFCLWRGTPGRLLRGDFLLGLVFAVLPAIIWLGGIWAGGQHDAVLTMLREQIWVKAFGDAAHKEPWWYYLAVFPAVWLPWSFTVLALPWQRLFSGSTWAGLKSARSGERQGLAFVWIFLLGAFALISLINHKQPVYLVPLMGPLAVLTGRAVLQLSPFRSAVLQRLMAVFFFLLAVSFVLLPVYYSGDIPAVFSWLENVTLPAWEVKINGIFLLAVVMLGTACLLLGVIKARRPESTLLVALLGATLFSWPLGSMTMPSLDKVVSSQAASVELRRYADLGYYPVSFKVYSGVFSYYSGIIINETGEWAELERMVEANPRIIAAMSASRWEDWTKNPGFTEIMRFWMLSNEYVLLLRNTMHEEPEAETPELQGPPLENTLPDETAPAEMPPDVAMPGAVTPDETKPDGVTPGEVNSGESAPDKAAPEKIIPEDGALPPAGESAPAGVEGAGGPGGVDETAPPAEQPGVAAEPPAETPAESKPEEPAENAPDAQPEPPVPSGTPVVDEPIPQDPFAPVPAE